MHGLTALNSLIIEVKCQVPGCHRRLSDMFDTSLVRKFQGHYKVAHGATITQEEAIHVYKQALERRNG